MEDREKITSIFKSDDPEKLEVFYAASLENEIRFYLNYTQYFTAVECEEGCSVSLKEERIEECNKKRKIAIIIENLMNFIILILITLGILVSALIGVFYILEFLIIVNLISFAMHIVSVISIEAMLTPFALKSKHSAEHMMVSFLEINKRLPKDIKEVKKISRFSPDCGSRELINGMTEELIRSLFATIFVTIISAILLLFSTNLIAIVVVLLSTYYLVKFVVGKVIKKYNFIIEPIKKVMTNIVQLFNTTSRVKDEDIILAYYVAREWIQVVYPEFYNENEDVFWKQYLEVNDD